MQQSVPLSQALNNPCGYWLMACYAYEELERELMSDADFDQLCTYIVDNWLDVMDRWHAELIDPRVLADTGSSLAAKKPRREWPTQTFEACHHMLNCIHGVGQWGQPGPSYLRMRAERFPPTPPKQEWNDLC